MNYVVPGEIADIKENWSGRRLLKGTLVAADILDEDDGIGLSVLLLLYSKSCGHL